MKKQLLFLSIIILLFFSACLEDQVSSDFYCEKKGRDLGTVLLMPESEEFWIYQPGQKLYFQDSIGNEIIFEEYQPLVDTLEHMVIRHICGDQNSPEFERNVMTREVKRVYYKSTINNFFIYYNVVVSLLDATDDSETLYDHVFVNALYSNFNFVSSKRGNDFDTPYYLWLGRYEQTDTTLLGRTFTDVYFEEEDIYSGFLNKEKGLIAFYDYNRTLFVLDRIE